MGTYRILQVRLADDVWIILPVVALVGVGVLLFALLFGALEKEDLQMLPAGDRLCAFLKKCKLMK
jgi:hypothetical protein